MHTFKRFIFSLFILGSALYGTDFDPSNPGECELKCKPEIVLTDLTDDVSVFRLCENDPTPDIADLLERVQLIYIDGLAVFYDKDGNQCGLPIPQTFDKSQITWNPLPDPVMINEKNGTITLTGFVKDENQPEFCKVKASYSYIFKFMYVDPLKITGGDLVAVGGTLNLGHQGGKHIYEFSSLDPAIATVDPDTGTVTGVSPGQAEIGLIDGCDNEDSITVNVFEPIPPVDCEIIKRPTVRASGITALDNADFCNVSEFDEDTGTYKGYEYRARAIAEDGEFRVNNGPGQPIIPTIKYQWTVVGGGLFIIKGANSKTVEIGKFKRAEDYGHLICKVWAVYNACDEVNTETEPDFVDKLIFTGCAPRASAHQPSNQFTNSDINGQPKLIQKPQGGNETDNASSKFSVDAYSLTSTFSTTDISIPLQGSDLRLEVRRTNSPATVNLIPELNTPIDYENEPYKKLLGRSWSTNIAARIHLRNEYETVETLGGNAFQINESIFTVMDDSGGQYRYWQAGYDVDEGFSPVKDSFNDQNSSHHKLFFEAEDLIWKKKNGTVYHFEKIPVPDVFLTIRLSHLYRVKTITDRNGNQLEYVYDDTVESNFPEEIRYVQQPSLKIEFEYEAVEEQVGFFTSEITRLKSAKDPKGRIIEYTYHDNGQLHKVIHPEVEVVTELNSKITAPERVFEEYNYQIFNDSDILILPSKTFYTLSSAKDFKGNETSFVYTFHRFSALDKGRLQLSTLTTPDGTSEYKTLSHSNLGRINEITDNNGNVWNYNFATSKRFTFRDNDSVEFLLDQFSRTVTPVDGSAVKSMSSEFEADTFNNVNLKKITDYSGVAYTYEYGTNIDVDYYKDGVKVDGEKYDFSRYSQPRFEILDAITPENPNGLNIKKEFGYEPKFNQMVKIVEPRGFEAGNLPDDFTTWYDIDSTNGNRKREIAPLGKETHFTYDLGFQTSATDADGRKTTSSRVYDATGWTDTSIVTGYQNELAITSVKKCDLVGNVVQTTDANGNVTDNTYDAMNSLEFTVLPAVENFDAENATLVRPKISVYRDENRQVVTKEDARGNLTFTEYDGMLRPKKTTVKVSLNGAEDIISEIDYDELGNKSQVIDPRGVIYAFGYDAFNNLIEEKKNVGGGTLELTSTYEYGDFSGNDLFGDAGFVPTKKTDPRGLVTILEYDNAYRLVRTKRGRAGSEILLSQIDYDASGNVEKTTTFNNKISNLAGDYIDDPDGLISGNQETVTAYDFLNRPIATAVNLNDNGASITDSADIVTHTFYDLTGNVVKVIDPEGHSSQTEYDGAGRVVKQLVNLDYNETTKVDNPEIESVDGNDFAIKESLVDIVTSKTYDDNSNILTETIHNDTPIIVDGVATTLGDQTVAKAYDALNRPFLVTDPVGNSTETKYDLNSNVRYVKNARGFETESEYDEANRAFKQVLPLVYDAETDADVSPEVLSHFDTNSNVVKTVDTRGLVTLSFYDNLNRLEEFRQVVIEADDTKDIVSINEYDGNNNLVKTTFERGDIDPILLTPIKLVTSTVYDSLDRPLMTTDPEEFKSVVFCDLIGNKVKLFDKRANANADETVNAEPQLRYFTQVKFDLANRMVKNTLPEIPIASRDGFGDVNEVDSQPFSEVTYLKNNWVINTKDLNGNVTTTEYDGAGRKKKITTAITQITEFEYDKSSNVVKQEVYNDNVGGNQITSYEYEKRNLLLKEILNKDEGLLQRVYEYGYDENGNKNFRKFPNGNETTYQYDALDRLTLEDYDAQAAENREYFYNNNGAVVLAKDETGSTEYDYDILGRQIKETKKDTLDNILTIVESVYDKANNRIRCFFPNDKKTLVSFYDKRNLLKIMKGYHGRVTLGGEAGLPVETTTYSYNPNGQQVTCTTPNGQTTTKTYDKADRIEASTTNANGLDIYTVTYKRDAVGNQLETIETRYDLSQDRVRTLGFIYDNVYRLTTESDDVSGQNVITEYEFDLQGNRLNKIVKDANGVQTAIWIYTTDKLNQTGQVNYKENNVLVKTYDYLYDDNGNRSLKKETDAVNAQVVVDHIYNYDQENRLKSVVDPSGDIFTASYDYRTRRLTKGEGTSQAQNTLKTTNYVYDGGVSCQETEEQNGIDVLVKQYIRGNGMGGGIGSVCYMERVQDLGSLPSNIQTFYDNLGQGNGTNGSGLIAEYYAYNAVGSVVANTDQQGFVIRENDFDAYGNQVREQDWTSDNFPIEFGGSSNDLLFSTKERDFSTGLDYFGFRYYDAVLGKFTTRDPSGYPDGPNNYLYVNNNPINAIDPLGLEKKPLKERLSKAWDKLMSAPTKTKEAFVKAGTRLKNELPSALSRAGSELANVPSRISSSKAINDSKHLSAQTKEDLKFALGFANSPLAGTGSVGLTVASDPIQAGKSALKALSTPIETLGKISVEVETQWKAGSAEKGSITYNSLMTGFGIGGGYQGLKSLTLTGIGKVKNVISRNKLTNPLPENGLFSRVVPNKYAKEFAENNGNIAGGNEVFIGAYDDLFGLTDVTSVQKKLSTFNDSAATIPNLSLDTIIQFKIKDLSQVRLRSPIETYPPRGYGFEHGGQTGGGSREWVIDNGTAKDLSIYDIKLFDLEKK